MGEISLDIAVEGPGTHALVVGVSRYPYLDGELATTLGKRLGMVNLSSAARSAAEVVSWLLTEYRNPDAPLASLRVLLSPADGETIRQDVASRLPDAHAATRAALEQDLAGFRDCCRARTENVGFVYVAGHGVQLTKRGATVLLEDMAHPDHLNELHGAVDLLSCWAGLNGDGFAGTQLWFVDSCRQMPAIAQKFEQLEGALTLSEPVGQVHSSPLVLASSSRELAFAEPDATTLFSSALLAALRGAGAKGPDEPSGDWYVPVSRLVELLNPAVQKLAGGRGEQHVDITGRVNEAVVHRLDQPPDVPVVLSLDPQEAAAITRASLLFNGDDPPIVDQVSDWPMKATVRAGLYVLKVDTEPPYTPIAGRPIGVLPPQFLDSVKVT